MFMIFLLPFTMDFVIMFSKRFYIFFTFTIAICLVIFMLSLICISLISFFWVFSSFRIILFSLVSTLLTAFEFFVTYTKFCKRLMCTGTIRTLFGRYLFHLYMRHLFSLSWLEWPFEGPQLLKASPPIPEDIRRTL